jgi:hypothetical protein
MIIYQLQSAIGAAREQKSNLEKEQKKLESAFAETENQLNALAGQIKKLDPIVVGDDLQQKPLDYAIGVLKQLSFITANIQLFFLELFRRIDSTLAARHLELTARMDSHVDDNDVTFLSLFKVRVTPKCLQGQEYPLRVYDLYFCAMCIRAKNTILFLKQLKNFQVFSN